MDGYGQLPLSFEANHGQIPPEFDFLARGSGYTLFLNSQQAVLALDQPPDEEHDATSSFGSPSVVSLHFLGASPQSEARGLDELPGKVNYLLGHDPDGWRRQIPIYAKVQYDALYPGIDVVYYANHGKLEYDFIVQPGADLGVIQFRFEGTERLEIDEQGNLVLTTALGEIHQSAPALYQDIDGVRHLISGGYQLTDASRVGFQVGPFDPRHPLIIDPVLSYSTYLGGNGADGGRRIAVDRDGHAYVTGYTRSTDFPRVDPVQATNRLGPQDAFVVKLNPEGDALVYATYLGGRGDDVGRNIAIAADGSVNITGYTYSSDFPTKQAWQPHYGTGGDAFVAKLTPDGSALTFSTFLGGNNADVGRGLAVDSSDSVYVAGRTASANFPTKDPFQARKSARSDAFVTKLSASGTLVYSTFLGGSGTTGLEQAYDIAVDAQRNMYAVGRTDSSTFPTTSGAYQTRFGGGNSDAFITKLNAAGSRLVFSTFLGGHGEDRGRAIAIDSGGSPHVTGNTFSTDFPVAQAFQRQHAGGSDAYVARLSANGAQLVYSSYLGGPDHEVAKSIAIDEAGNAHITGDVGTQIDLESVGPPVSISTMQRLFGGNLEDRASDPEDVDIDWEDIWEDLSEGLASPGSHVRLKQDDSTVAAAVGFPIVNAVQPAYGGGNSDAFVTKVKANGVIVYSTYLGGSGTEAARGIALDDLGNAYVTGKTGSTNFPTENPLQETKRQSSDVFVTKISR